MAENDQAPLPEADDDLLNWMPPELIERARRYEERDANTQPPKDKKKRIDYTKPPKGRHRTLSLAALAGGALLLVIGAILSLIGENGTQAMLEKGRLWLALWLAGQAGTLGVYLLCLLPLGKSRRPALVFALGAGLVFGLAASVTVMLRGDRGEASPAFQIVTVIFSLLIAMAFHANTWLILGALRRKTTEKFSALMGGVNLAISLLGLITTLARGNADTAVLVTALGIVQGLCYLCLLVSWPVLDRCVLSKEEGETDGQLE